MGWEVVDRSGFSFGGHRVQSNNFLGICTRPWSGSYGRSGFCNWSALHQRSVGLDITQASAEIKLKGLKSHATVLLKLLL